MDKRFRKNYIFNLLYQIFTLITPLITTPFVSRVLGSSGIGQYSFAYSIASYFVLFASLGFSYYAQREIARFQNNKHTQSVVFWEIIIARSISVIISLIVYIVLIISNVFRSYNVLMLIFIINIIAVAFDVTFLFQGNENFSIIAIRNIIIKTIGILLIFLFVRDESDVWLYAFSHSITLIISNLSLWPQLPKLIDKVRCSELNYKRHFSKTIQLFIPTIAMSIYTMLDKTLIGILIPGNIEVVGIIKKVSDIENGYYEQSEKLVKMATTIVGVLGSLMLPRNSNAAEQGNLKLLKANVYMAFRYVFFVGVPIAFGLAGVAGNLTPWFFGPGYDKVVHLIIIFSPMAVVLGISNVIGIQYLLPIQEDKKYTISICAGSVINLLLNIILIPKLFSYGAAIASLLAEICISLIMWAMTKKDFSIKRIMQMNWKYCLSGVVMFLIVYFIGVHLRPTMINTMLLVIVGIISYFVMLFLLKDELIKKIIETLFIKMKLHLQK